MVSVQEQHSRILEVQQRRARISSGGTNAGQRTKRKVSCNFSPGGYIYCASYVLCNFLVTFTDDFSVQSLESWSTSPDHRAFFRKRMWGGFNMISQVTFSREKWIAAMMLDPVTGLDPPNVKVRAAEGIDAASSFLQGYWIW